MKMKTLLVVPFLIFSSLCAEEQAEVDVSLISEAFGHMLYKGFEKDTIKLNLEKFARGMENAAAGKESPLLRKELIEAYQSDQEKKFKILCAENLKHAEEFLASNAKKEGIVSLEGGKVQYQVISSGSGPSVKPHSSPLICCSVKDSNDFDVFSPNLTEPISLDEALPGLEAGLLGMKEGEKRILYIHPDLAYQEKGLSTSRPNMLITFEIEVLKTDTRN